MSIANVVCFHLFYVPPSNSTHMGLLFNDIHMPLPGDKYIIYSTSYGLLIAHTHTHTHTCRRVHVGVFKCASVLKRLHISTSVYPRDCLAVETAHVLISVPQWNCLPLMSHTPRSGSACTLLYMHYIIITSSLIITIHTFPLYCSLGKGRTHTQLPLPSWYLPIYQSLVR